MTRTSATKTAVEHSWTGRSAGPAAVLVAILACAALVSSPAGAAPQPQNIEVLALYENFESSIGGKGWAVADSDPVNGTDTWGTTDARAAAGSASAWSAAVGDKTTFATMIASTFENGLGAWQIQDRNTSATYGLDYWGISTYRAHNGTSSIWCAQVGQNRYNGGDAQSNVQMHLYDSDMNSTMTQNVNIAGYSDVRLNYWYWVDTEASWDGLYVMYFDSAWHYEDQKGTRKAAAGWQYSSFVIPQGATMVGFLFTSDSSINYEGAYLDDITLTGMRIDQNRDVGEYDDGMASTLTHAIDLSAYPIGRVSYRYWLDTASEADWLEGMYLVGDTWNYADRHNASSGGWAASSFMIPADATMVGFRFMADATGHREGAYLDELKVFGIAYPLNCTATVSSITGMEGLTEFSLSGTATDGVRPYTWSWDLGDGAASVLQFPFHHYEDIGTYQPVVTVRDALGQICSARTPEIEVSHDITNAIVSPLFATVTEGGQVVAYGTDARGHAYDVAWALEPSECGAVQSGLGATVTVDIAANAGGLQCTLTGSIGPVASTTTIFVMHDVTQVSILPATARVVEGGGITLSAKDAHGHALDFLWATTCGGVEPGPAATTHFAALAEGGVDCTVTASYGFAMAVAVVSIVHDTSTISVTPRSATMTEGETRSFSAIDVYEHPFDAVWSSSPAECGSFSIERGASTVFAASHDAGGMECTVAANFGGNRTTVPVTVEHDTRELAVSPTAAVVVEGGALSFSLGDGYGHPVTAAWSLSPAACGVLAPTAGASTSLTVATDAGDLTCTLAALALGRFTYARVEVNHGAPVSVVLAPLTDYVDAGASLLIKGGGLDSNGHALSGMTFEWSTTCGSLSSTSGPTTYLTAPSGGGGTSCTVTGTHAGMTDSAEIAVHFAEPLTLEVTPSVLNLPAGSSTELTAEVTDAHGQRVPNANIRWSASCGEFSSSTGEKVTYTAPSGLGGQSCSVLASVDQGGAAYQNVQSVATGMSLFIPLGIIAAVAVAAVVVWRLRARNSAAQGAALSSETGAASSVPLACPNCGAAVEQGWAACASCGNALGQR